MNSLILLYTRIINSLIKYYEICTVEFTDNVASANNICIMQVDCNYIVMFGNFSNLIILLQ